jgi:DNA-binding response OmpR family regulator
MRVLVVEDDLRLQTLLERALEGEGHDVVLSASAKVGIEQVHSGHFDVAVVDRGLPDDDGLEVCRRARGRTPRPAVIVLTAMTSVHDRVEGLDAGADDYLIKPFAMAELMARVRALGRRRTDHPRLSHGPITVEFETHRAWCDGEELHLTRKEFSMLELFVRRAGHVLSRSQILEHAWDYGFTGESNIVDVYIRRLRSKLEQCDGGNGDGGGGLIHTVYGLGYRLTAA